MWWRHRKKAKVSFSVLSFRLPLGRTSELWLTFRPIFSFLCDREVEQGSSNQQGAAAKKLKLQPKFSDNMFQPPKFGAGELPQGEADPGVIDVKDQYLLYQNSVCFLSIFCLRFSFGQPSPSPGSGLLHLCSDSHRACANYRIPTPHHDAEACSGRKLGAKAARVPDGIEGDRGCPLSTPSEGSPTTGQCSLSFFTHP